MTRLKTETRVVANHAGGFNSIGLFWSVMLWRHVVFESLAERHFLIFLERLRVKYTEQPRRFQIIIDGKETTYVSDLGVPRLDGDIHFQVKPLKKALQPKIERRMQQVRVQLGALGMQHFVFSPEIYSKAYWVNLRMLYGYVIRHVDSPLAPHVLALLSQREHWQLREAVSALRSQGMSLGPMYTAMFYREIRFDEEKKITARSKISVTQRRPTVAAISRVTESPNGTASVL